MLASLNFLACMHAHTHTHTHTTEQVPIFPTWSSYAWWTAMFLAFVTLGRASVEWRSCGCLVASSKISTVSRLSPLSESSISHSMRSQISVWSPCSHHWSCWILKGKSVSSENYKEATLILFFSLSLLVITCVNWIRLVTSLSAHLSCRSRLMEILSALYWLKKRYRTAGNFGEH